jgi:hypothetical protein
MSAASPPLLTAPELRTLANRPDPPSACSRCAALVCPGWEALSATFERKHLGRIGTLRDPHIEEPTLLEHHPEGTNGWSVQAPIAPAFFPYNRCEVWACIGCDRPFLRYTEYGGYYEEERIRAIDSARVVDATL